MNIIILGMDNSGKSTLCKILSYELKFNQKRFVDLNLPKEKMIENIKKYLKKDNIIFDRFSFFDEIVYGEILRNNPLFSFKDEIYQEIIKSSPIIIYCRPDISLILNWKDREQMEGVIEKSLKLIEKYDDVFSKYISKDFHSIIWDYEKDSIIKLINFINLYKEKI